MQINLLRLQFSMLKMVLSTKCDFNSLADPPDWLLSQTWVSRKMARRRASCWLEDFGIAINESRRPYCTHSWVAEGLGTSQEAYFQFVLCPSEYPKLCFGVIAHFSV